MKHHSLVAVLFVCAVVPAVAQTPSAQIPSQAPCLRQIDMYSFDPVPGNRSLVVEDRRRQRYRLNFSGICTGLQYKLGLRFKTFSNTNLACLSRGDEVLQRDPVGPGRCVIHDIQMQTPALDKADADAKVKP